MGHYDSYRNASDKVNARILFYTHIAVYLMVNVILVIINLKTFPRYLWFRWVLIAWGIGLLFHAAVTFIFFGETGIRERMIEKELKKSS